MSTMWNIGHITTKRNSPTSNKVAIIYEDRFVTYKELNDGVNRVANCLQQKGIEKGDRISVLLRNCPEFFEIYFAAAKLGLVFVPLNVHLAGPELEYQLNDSGACLLVFHDNFNEVVNSVRARVNIEPGNFIYLESETDDAPESPVWASNYHEVMKNSSVHEPQPKDFVYLDDPLAMLYTSGVTGAPKGAVLSHEQTYFKAFQNIIYMDMREDDVYVSQMPLFHSAGLFISGTPCFCRGATLVMRQRFEPIKFVEDIEKFKATVVMALTSMWRLILQTGKLDDVDVSSVRVVLGGGERTPPSMFDELAERGLYMQQGFGQTENSLMTVLPKEDIQRKQGSVGLPGLFTQVWIIDEQGNELPPNQVGEIVATGPTVMSGYWNMPEKTKETIIDGVLHTGDVGCKDEEGYLYVTDRANDMYRSGGENVYPAEIEKILASHPKIAHVAIIGVPDEKWGETGKAFVVPQKGEEITKDEIISFLDGKVARYRFPTYVEFLDQLPMTASGKIKKVELKMRRLDDPT